MGEVPAGGGETVRTVCSYCGVGCGMVLQIGTGPDGRPAVTRSSGDKEHPANFGRLCTKGATTADMLAAPGRLTTALVRPKRGAAPNRPDSTPRRIRGGPPACGRSSTSTARTPSRSTSPAS